MLLLIIPIFLSVIGALVIYDYVIKQHLPDIPTIPPSVTEAINKIKQQGFP